VKVYTRDAFMELPAGVMYGKGKPWYFSEWGVKGDTLRDADGRAIDWIYLSLFDIDGDHMLLDDMLENGSSVPLNVDMYGRDGCFDKDELFLVFERPDLNAFSRVLETVK
jgi:hypothetical protein